LPCSHQRGVTRCHRRRSEARIELASAPGHDSIIDETQSQTAKSDFKPGSRFGVADEKIRDAQRVRIECAANRNAKLAKSKSPEVLHAR
jgi:hypothetical protein